MRLVKNCLTIGVIVYSPAASENNAIRATTTVLRLLISRVAPQVRLTARCHQ